MTTTTASTSYVAAVGPTITYTSGATAQNYGGFRTTNTVASRRFNPKITCKCQIDSNTNSRLKIGFSSSTAILDSAGNTLDSLSGFIIGFGSGNTTYFVYTNNGAATTTATNTSVNTVTAGSAVVFTLSLNDSTGLISWTIKTGPSTSTSGTVSTAVPTIDTPMYLFCTAQTSTTAARALTVEWLDILLSDVNSF
jgi:hypothetical protein